MFWRKKRLKKSYSAGLSSIMVSLYGVIVSILQDELSEHYSTEDLKNAAAITVNKIVLRPEDRPDPSLSNDKLASLISELKELTMIKEAASLVLLFDYFISDKTDTARYEEAKELGGPDFETINSLLDIDKTSANKIQSIAAVMINKLNEISSFDIRKNMVDLPPEDSSDDILSLNAVELNEEVEVTHVKEPEFDEPPLPPVCADTPPLPPDFDEAQLIADQEALHHLESESSKKSGTTISNEDASRVAHGSVELLTVTVDGYESGQTSQVVPKIVDAVGGDRETTKNVVGGELLCLLMRESLKGIEMFIAMSGRGMPDFASCADAFRSQIASTVGRVYDTDPAEMDRYFRERVIYYIEAEKRAPKESRSQVLAESWTQALEGQLNVQLEAQFREATIDEVATLVSDYPKRQQMTLIRWVGKL